MANVKKEVPSLDFQIEELKKKIEQKDNDIKLAEERRQKENELVEFHKAKVKKYSEDIRNMNLQKKGLRMDLMDLRADIANVDRDQYFESVMSAADNNIPKAEPERKVEGAAAPLTATREKTETPGEGKEKSGLEAPKKNPDSENKESVNNKEADKSKTDDNITPLEKARAEFAKKNPSGISIAERCKQK